MLPKWNVSESTARADLRRQQRTIRALLNDLSRESATCAAPRLVSQLGDAMVALLTAEEEASRPAVEAAWPRLAASPCRPDHPVLRGRLRGVLRASVEGEPLTGPLLELRQAFARHVVLEEQASVRKLARGRGPSRKSHAPAV